MPTMRHGIHRPLEDEANRILRESLRGVTKHSEKSDVLTPWKDAERHRREVYPSSGVADPAIRRGMFNRASNPARPELNSRDGIARARQGITASLQAFVDEHGIEDE
jgi:hypothetical protein